MARGEHDRHRGRLPSGEHAAELPGIDKSVLAAEKLDVADLYRDLARVQARELVEILSGQYVLRPEGATGFAQALDCLTETAAHLEAAAVLLADGGARESQLRGLGQWLLEEAAAFAHTADLLSGARS